uniref:Dysbindin domain-containing protein 1 n=1 Tax=Sarcophilus harrisii TaxID=9305 RepID=A0A7N4NFP0_SARHA
MGFPHDPSLGSLSSFPPAQSLVSLSLDFLLFPETDFQPGQGRRPRALPSLVPLSFFLLEPLSSVSSLEVHFDLLDLTELTDMSDQELAEVFADSDDENAANESPAGLHTHPLPRAGYLRSPSWTRTKAEQNREKKHLSDSELQAGIVDTFLTIERPKEN